MSELKGIIAPFTTPFKESGEINFDLVKPQVDWLLENGVHGLAAGGSTGEGHALERDEYKTLMEETSKAINNRVPLVAGIIANSTAEVIARGKSVKHLDVAALQITPLIIYSSQTTMPWSSISEKSMQHVIFQY